MSKINNPYGNLPKKNFWRPSVAELNYIDLDDLSNQIPIKLNDKIATAGSCFAQHIGRNLQLNGANYLDLEPPPSFVSDELAKKFGFNVYSCRYGNIYTVRQLLQLFDEAMGQRSPTDYIWEKNGRYYDALRPSVDPVGFEFPNQVINMRTEHLKCVKSMFELLDVFVFTLGLTEAWVSLSDGTVYPTAAGTIAGSHDEMKYGFKNFSFFEIVDDLRSFISKMQIVNPKFKMLLTVSPVPLNATASDDHVLVATMKSKSILRAAADQITNEFNNVFYFPSYEIILSHPSRGMFFEPDLRNVNHFGVQYVMSHFFKAIGNEAQPVDDDCEVICDESMLDVYSTN